MSRATVIDDKYLVPAGCYRCRFDLRFA